MKKLSVIFAAALVGLAASAADIKTAVFTVDPPMTCNNCVTRIKTNMRFERGVKGIEPSLKDQKVTIKYDAEKTSEDKIVEGFKKIGYEATPVKSDNKQADATDKD